MWEGALPNSDEFQIRWLTDAGLPEIEAEDPDTLHLGHCTETILSAACGTGRWIATTNRLLLETRRVPSNRPPIVLLNGGEWTAAGLTRNLLHFQFCLSRSDIPIQQDGMRFLVEMDRAIYRVSLEGRIEEVESWKVPSVRPVLAMGAST